MKMNRSRYGVGLSAVALSVALLQACGGGSGTGSPTTASLAGTVTGFGSVVVDGVEVEDAYAQVAHENADGTYTNDVLQMGHRVRVSHDGAHKASQVLIDAAVIGVVSKVDTSTNTLIVAGQEVTVNTDSNNTTVPLTVFGGDYTGLSTVKEDHLVQVHGTPVYDSTSKTYKVQATRIQKDTGSPRVQVSGKIANYTSTSFTLNGLTVNTSSTTAVRPSGSTLANDVQVTAYGGSLSGSVLTATNIRVDRNQSSANTTMSAQLSGAVSNYNASAGTFELQGTTVKIGTATVQPTGKSVQDKSYVRVQGTLASDGTITATQILVRADDTTTDLAKVLLIGTISDYVDPSSFVVRGVPVDATGVTLNNCSTNTLSGYTGTVKVQATQQANTAVVLATRIDCQSTNTTKLIKPYEGTVASVDSTAKTFSLTSGGSTRTVQWNDTTTFSGLTVTTLQGQPVHVDGYNDTNGVFVARVVRLDDDSNSAPARDDKKFRARQNGSTKSAAESAWKEYRQKRNGGATNAVAN